MINAKYELWCKKAIGDPDLVAELENMKGNDELINEAFYKDLEFGTGGLRGIIGAGTNRLNIYTVGKATQGLAAYINSITDNGTVAIAYDSRIKSDVFAKISAQILAANGIKAYIYKELMPTPMLSFAVRHLKCDAGIVITASHNPAKYNGYKAYGPDGCQLGLEAAEYVLDIMNKVDTFDGVKTIDFDKALKDGKIEYISDDVFNTYIDLVETTRVLPELDLSDLNVVYTPLHGSGNKPVRAILKQIGVKNVTVVPEQELPNGNFPTAPYPNPEIRQAFECALKLAETVKPDLLMATDPDSDRIGIAIPKNGEYKLLTGNDVGALLMNFILSVKKENGTLPENPVAVKTIVSTELCTKIAAAYGCDLKNVLTGFKFIGEQIALLEEKGEEKRYLFGFEESYGYLAGTFVRDKDAVIASMLICEMTAYYKSKGMDLLDVLDSLYKTYGYYFCTQKSYTFEGQAGMAKIAAIMDNFHENPMSEVDGNKVVIFKDYKISKSQNLVTGETEDILLPSSNVVYFEFEDGSSFIARPSGTEPKIKFYINALGKDADSANSKVEEIVASIDKMLN